MSLTLVEMTAEIREVNIAHGWRPAEGGPGSNTLGDYVALLHSELSEALEAYRDHRLADATGFGDPTYDDATGYRTGSAPGKPEGVGSEFADVLIRLLDMCDVFGIRAFPNWGTLADIRRFPVLPVVKTFGDHITWLHRRVAAFGALPAWTMGQAGAAAEMLAALVTVCDVYGVDLEAEYVRKIAYNRTRAFRHGGRTLADS